MSRSPLSPAASPVSRPSQAADDHDARRARIRRSSYASATAFVSGGASPRRRASSPGRRRGAGRAPARPRGRAAGAARRLGRTALGLGDRVVGEARGIDVDERCAVVDERPLQEPVDEPGRERRRDDRELERARRRAGLVRRGPPRRAVAVRLDRGEQLERAVPVAVERLDRAGRSATACSRSARRAGCASTCACRIDPAARSRHLERRVGRRRPTSPAASASRKTAASSRGASSSSFTISSPRRAVEGQWTRRSDSPCSCSRTLCSSKPVGRRMISCRPPGVRPPDVREESSRARRGADRRAARPGRESGTSIALEPERILDHDLDDSIA